MCLIYSVCDNYCPKLIPRIVARLSGFWKDFLSRRNLGLPPEYSPVIPDPLRDVFVKQNNAQGQEVTRFTYLRVMRACFASCAFSYCILIKSSLYLSLQLAMSIVRGDHCTVCKMPYVSEHDGSPLSYDRSTSAQVYFIIQRRPPLIIWLIHYQ